MLKESIFSIINESNPTTQKCKNKEIKAIQYFYGTYYAIVHIANLFIKPNSRGDGYGHKQKVG